MKCWPRWTKANTIAFLLRLCCIWLRQSWKREHSGLTEGNHFRCVIGTVWWMETSEPTGNLQLWGTTGMIHSNQQCTKCYSNGEKLQKHRNAISWMFGVSTDPLKALKAAHNEQFGLTKGLSRLMKIKRPYPHMPPINGRGAWNHIRGLSRIQKLMTVPFSSETHHLDLFFWTEMMYALIYRSGSSSAHWRCRPC